MFFIDPSELNTKNLVLLWKIITASTIICAALYCVSGWVLGFDPTEGVTLIFVGGFSANLSVGFQILFLVIDFLRK